MAKIKLDLDIDFINEDYTLAEETRKQLLAKIEKGVIEKNMNSWTLTDLQNKTITEGINKAINKFIKDFMKKEIVNTNRWGEEENRTTVEQRIKDELTALISKEYNRDVIKKIIKEIVEKQMEHMKKEVEDINKELIRSSINDLQTNNEIDLLRTLAQKILKDTSLTNYITK